MKTEITNRIMDNILWIMIMSVAIGINVMIATISSIPVELKYIAVVIMVVLIVTAIQKINLIEKLLKED